MKPLHNPFFVKFIVYFNKNQDFFECHEVLEDYWKSLPGEQRNIHLRGISYLRPECTTGGEGIQLVLFAH